MAALPLLGCNSNGTCVQMNATPASGSTPAQDTCITHDMKQGCGAPESTFYPESDEEGASRCKASGFTVAAAGTPGTASVYTRAHK